MTKAENDRQVSNAMVPAHALSPTGLDTFKAFGEPLCVVGGTDLGGPIRAVNIKQLLHHKWTILGVFGLVFFARVDRYLDGGYTQIHGPGEILVRPIIPTLVFRTEENG